ncbi:hypothetical protein, partial [Streptomyces sp. DH12]|uniref:hypothetical protein n=1 Tax=Streptomyces sp. DH12 TaxID=2857010 RepID=UPI001E390BED
LCHPLERAAGPFSAFAFPFPAIPTLSDPFSVPFPVRILFPMAVGGLLPFGCRYVSRSPAVLIIEPLGMPFGKPKWTPSGVIVQ